MVWFLRIVPPTVCLIALALAWLNYQHGHFQLLVTDLFLVAVTAFGTFVQWMQGYYGRVK